MAAVLFGCGAARLAEEPLSLGVDVVYKVDAPPLAYYNSWLYPRLLEKLVREEDPPPHSILIGATYAGMDLAPAVAARLGAGCSAHCVRLDLDEQGNLLQDVPGFGGAVMATIVTPFARPQIATVKPGVLPAPDFAPAAKRGEVKEIAFTFPGAAPVRVLSVKQEEYAEVSLEKAEVVVAGGAGVGSREGWAKIEELAHLLTPRWGRPAPRWTPGGRKKPR